MKKAAQTIKAKRATAMAHTVVNRLRPSTTPFAFRRKKTKVTNADNVSFAAHDRNNLVL